MMAFKITCIGDAAVGKTDLILTYLNNESQSEYLPSVIESYLHQVTINEKDYSLVVWDTTGLNEFTRLRPLTYPNTDCFLICYSIACKTSYENIITQWIPEIKHFSKHTPIVLIGTKSDLRLEDSEKFVTTQEGMKLKEKIGAFSYVECSAKNKINVSLVFEEAIIAIEKRKENSLKKKSCKIF